MMMNPHFSSEVEGRLIVKAQNDELIGEEKVIVVQKSEKCATMAFFRKIYILGIRIMKKKV